MDFKKPVCVRVPPELYEKLVERSAELTIERSVTVSIPGLIVELVKAMLDQQRR